MLLTLPIVLPLNLFLLDSDSVINLVQRSIRQERFRI